MHYPDFRPRRMRSSGFLRELCQDINLGLSDFIQPVFVKSGKSIDNPIKSMPGISQYSSDKAVEYVFNLADKGINSFIFFGVIDTCSKDPSGSIASEESNPVIDTLKQLRQCGFKGNLIADLCFCEYTDHGHCGILSKDQDETIDNDKTLEILSQQAVAMAKAGANIIAPSGMIDGMVSAIRFSLDENGFSGLPILSYSVKYASNFYGPFRDAAEGAPKFGNRASYQLDFRRSLEWETEVSLDIAEGTDMLMVKPGLAYLDILAKMRQLTSLPLGVYQVSGEYSMLQAAAANGWLDLKSTALESCYAFKRAGADFIVSYFAADMSDWL